MIKIICVGKLKEDYLKEGVKDYLKRIQKYHKVNLIEISESDLLTEAKEIRKYLSNKDYVVVLSPLGEELSSLDLAKKIDVTFISYSTITFIIGSSYGIDESIKKISHANLSFSKLTYPHGLFRIILLEQIYRSFKIIHNETYHK